MPVPQYRPTLVDPYRDHLRRRREQDPAVPVLQLLHEITELGYTGSQNLLYRYITHGRVESDRPAMSPKRLTRYLLTHPDKLKDHQREWIDAATGACPEMTGLSALIGDFAALLTPHTGNDERLARWIDQTRPEELPHLHAFTRGLQLDRQTVDAALTQPLHNGRTERVNTKTKADQATKVRTRRLHAPPPSHTPRMNYRASPPKMGQSRFPDRPGRGDIRMTSTR